MSLRAAIVTLIALVVTASPSVSSATPDLFASSGVPPYAASVGNSSGTTLVLIVAACLLPAVIMLFREKQRLPGASE